MRALFDIFVEQLENMYEAENQMVKNLPKLIKICSSPELRELLNLHLEETKEQVRRLEKVFVILKTKPAKAPCEALKGLLCEVADLVKSRKESAIVDAAIIAAEQKIEHYELASYTTLHSFAKHLGLDNEIVDLLQETLEEEGTVNQALLKLADGSFFSHSINRKAAMASAC